MNILLFSDQYYPMGGAIEQYIRFLSEELTRKGNSISILTRAVDGLPDSNIENSVTIIRRYELNLVISNPGKTARKWRKLKNIVRDLKPDVIYANHHSSLIAIKIGKYLSIPVVYGCHGWGLLCPLKIRLIKPDGSLCYNQRNVVDCQQCFNQMGVEVKRFPRILRYVKHQITKYVLIPRKVRQYSQYEQLLNTSEAKIGNSNLTTSLFDDMKTVYLGVDTDVYRKQSANAFRERFGINDQYILVPGRIDKIKGQEWAIRALSHLSPEYTLVIAGTSKLFSGSEDQHNSYLVHLKNMALEFGLDSRIIFTGLLERDELIQAYSGAVVTVVPSVWLESFGYVTAEAMACECPVVITDNCGSAELITDEVDGCIVPRMNGFAIAEAVKKIAEKREAMGIFARDTVTKKLTWSYIADQVQDILTKAVETN
ncbi:MAG: glycosyltransferase family 4 protein [Candidatus Marinimicrobia bacterium]|nr:glycosyltransferase family 4 protein [Candidatus Neomarinimicrobiota bacterium]